MASLPGLSRTPKYPKPEPGRIYVCLAGYVGPDGPIPQWARRRGSDPEVIRSIKFWVPEGLLVEELHAIFYERFPDAGMWT